MTVTPAEREQMRVLPRDLKPGDVVLRHKHSPIGATLVPVVVDEVKRVVGTAGPNLRFKVYLREWRELPGNRRNWAENRHLAPFIVPARQLLPAIASYDVEANYGHGHGFEVVCAEPSKAEADARVREYRENEPGVPVRRKRVVENVDE